MKTSPPFASENIAADTPASRHVERNLRGAKAIVLADGRAGHLSISLGVAEALGLDMTVKPVPQTGMRRLLAPWGPAESRALGNLLVRPWPAIVLGAGRLTVPYLRAIKRLTEGRIFTVVLQDPRSPLAAADLIWAPEHDRLRGANVIMTLTPPHRFSAQRLAGLRAAVPAAIEALTRPRIAVFLGGPGAGYAYKAADIERLALQFRAIAARSVSFMITPSRRTPPELLRALDAATASRPRILWTGQGDNPYPDFLAHADAIIVTADSASMVGEACATGRPVHVFHPQGGKPKFHRYHAALERHGAARPLSQRTDIAQIWTYRPLDAASEIAAEIERRWRSPPSGSCV